MGMVCGRTRHTAMHLRSGPGPMHRDVSRAALNANQRAIVSTTKLKLAFHILNALLPSNDNSRTACPRSPQPFEQIEPQPAMILACSMPPCRLHLLPQRGHGGRQGSTWRRAGNPACQTQQQAPCRQRRELAAACRSAFLPHSTAPEGNGEHAEVAPAPAVSSGAVNVASSSAAPWVHVVVGVDPDTHGAISVLSWSSPGGPMAAPPMTMPLPPPGLRVQLFDMPCVLAQLRSRQAKGPKGSKVVKQPQRRWLDISSAAGIVASALPAGAPAGASLHLHAFIEVSPIQPLQSHLSKVTVSYSTGVWHGLLAALGFTTRLVPVKAWKGGMGLAGADKEASRARALQVFGDKAAVLSRCVCRGIIRGGGCRPLPPAPTAFSAPHPAHLLLRPVQEMRPWARGGPADRRLGCGC